jgi:3-oxoacyl-[acyl-carrier protein] reductase
MEGVYIRESYSFKRMGCKAMGKKFEDQVVLVTGGSRGIGRAVALGFAARGASVAIVYVKNHEAAEETVKQIEEAGARGVAIPCDVRDWEAVQKTVEKINDQLGDINILVNCAGIVRDDLLVSMSIEDWRSVIETNLNGAFYFMRAVVEKMVLRREGRIINISSLAAERGGKGQANYAASKAGLQALTRAAALELGAKGITVNAIAPGMVLTEMSATVRDLAGPRLEKSVPMRRFAKPEDIVGAVLFLASPDASYINGVVIAVDGGLGSTVQYTA